VLEFSQHKFPTELIKDIDIYYYDGGGGRGD